MPAETPLQSSPPETPEALISKLQLQTLSVAKKLGDRIESAFTGSRSAEIPVELIKLWAPLITVADELNSISIAAAITRLTALGYRVSEGD